MLIGGVITALVTPFKYGGVDDAAVARLIETQLAAGVGALVIGSQAAGEGATLSADEALSLARLCVEVAGSSAAVIVDASSNATAAAIARARQAEAAGAACLLVSAPWYNRPSQEGLTRHFRAVAAATGLPIIVGNDASRSRADIGRDALAEIAASGNVIGLIEASPDVSRLSAARRVCPAHFRILAANDLTGLGALAHGAHGLVSVTANVLPEAMCAFHAAWAANDVPQARCIDDALRDLHYALHADPLPATVKALLAHRNICGAEVRLPITTVDETVIDAALAALTSAAV